MPDRTLYRSRSDGSFTMPPLVIADVLSALHGVDLNEITPHLFLFRTPERARIFCEFMAGRGWHSGNPFTKARRGFPNHYVSVFCSPPEEPTDG
jgi:hypothetical protein